MAADGSVVIETRMNTAQAEKDLAKLKSKIEKAEDNLDDTRQKRDAAAEKSVFDAAELDAEKAKLEQMKQDLQEMKAIAKDKGFSSGMRDEAKAQIPIAQAELAEQQQRVRALQSEWNKTQNTIERYDAKIADATQKIEQQKAEAGKLESALDAARTPAGRMTEAFEGSDGSFAKLGKRISGLAKRVFIFSMITAALRTLRTYLSKVIKTNDEANAAFSRLKGAMLALAQPLVEILIPALTALANILTVIVTQIASLLSSLFGKTAQQSADAAEELYDETQALEGVGGAAEEAAGSLAGFDEINTIQTSEKSGGGGGGAATGMPDFTLDTSISDQLKEIADLVILIATGLALWKIGTMIPGVLGDIATKLGGILLTIGGLLLFWNGLADAWENGVDWLNLIEMIGGVAAAAAGLYLLLGPIASGIALVVGGIAMLVTGFHDAMVNGWDLQNSLLAIAGLLIAGLGIAIITGSWIPLLIGAIAAVLLAITNLTGHGGELIAGLQEIFQGFKDFFTGVFTGDLALAAQGISEIFSGLGTAIGAVVDGIRDGILAFLTWIDEKTNGQFHTTIETIKTMVTGVFDGVKLILNGFLEFISGIFTGDLGKTVKGINDMISGVGMIFNSIIDGIKSLFNGFLDWLDEKTGGKLHGVIEFIRGLFNGLFDFVKTTLGGLLDALVQILTGVVEFISVVFTGDWNKAWAGVKDIFKGVFNGVVAILEGAVNLIIKGLNWLISQMNKIRFDVPSWVPGVGGKSIGINIPKISEITIPRLAQGAVIPPNREFMAVLGDQKSGTNVEAPLDTIKQALVEAMRETGGNIGNRPVQVNLVVDGKTLARVIVPQINDMTRQAGKSVLLY